MSEHFPFSESFSTAEHDHQHFTFQNQCLKRKLESEATNGFVVGEDLEMCGQEQEYSLISEVSCSALISLSLVNLVVILFDWNVNSGRLFDLEKKIWQFCQIVFDHSLGLKMPDSRKWSFNFLLFLHRKDLGFHRNLLVSTNSSPIAK